MLVVNLLDKWASSEFSLRKGSGTSQVAHDVILMSQNTSFWYQ